MRSGLHHRTGSTSGHHAVVERAGVAGAFDRYVDAEAVSALAQLVGDRAADRGLTSSGSPAHGAVHVEAGAGGTVRRERGGTHGAFAPSDGCCAPGLEFISVALDPGPTELILIGVSLSSTANHPVSALRRVFDAG